MARVGKTAVYFVWPLPHLQSGECLLRAARAAVSALYTVHCTPSLSAVSGAPLAVHRCFQVRGSLAAFQSWERLSVLLLPQHTARHTAHSTLPQHTARPTAQHTRRTPDTRHTLHYTNVLYFWSPWPLSTIGSLAGSTFGEYSLESTGGEYIFASIGASRRFSPHLLGPSNQRTPLPNLCLTSAPTFWRVQNFYWLGVF